MENSYPDLTKEIFSYLKDLKKHTPQFMQDNFALSQLAFAKGALDQKTKEMLALAIAVAARCDGCIGFHTQALVKLGITEQELAELLGVAIFMGGGPSLMTAADVLKAYAQFKQP